MPNYQTAESLRIFFYFTLPYRFRKEIGDAPIPSILEKKRKRSLVPKCVFCHDTRPLFLSGPFFEIHDMRLSLRTLLAFEDGVFDIEQQRQLERLIPLHEPAMAILGRIRNVVRDPSLAVPGMVDRHEELDPNLVAVYLDHQMSPEYLEQFESFCLTEDKFLGELASVHHIVSNVLGEPARTNRECRLRCYELYRHTGENMSDPYSEPVGFENAPSEEERQIISMKHPNHDHSPDDSKIPPRSEPEIQTGTVREKSSRNTKWFQILVLSILLFLVFVVLWKTKSGENGSVEENRTGASASLAPADWIHSRNEAPRFSGEPVRPIDVVPLSPFAPPELLTESGMPLARNPLPPPVAKKNPADLDDVASPVSQPPQKATPLLHSKQHSKVSSGLNIDPMSSPVLPVTALIAEKSDSDDVEKERIEKERIEKEKAEKEKEEREKAEREKTEREKAEREKAEKERIENEKAEKERVEKEKAELEKQSVLNVSPKENENTADIVPWFVVEPEPVDSTPSGVENRTVAEENPPEPTNAFPVPQETSRSFSPPTDIRTSAAVDFTKPASMQPPGSAQPTETKPVLTRSPEEIAFQSGHSQDSKIDFVPRDFPSAHRIEYQPIETPENTFELPKTNPWTVAHSPAPTPDTVSPARLSRTSRNVSSAENRISQPEGRQVSESSKIIPVGQISEVETTPAPRFAPRAPGRVLSSPEPVVFFTALSSNAPWKMESQGFELQPDQYLLTTTPFYADVDLEDDIRIEMIGDSKLCVLPRDEKGIPGIYLDYGRLVIRLREDKAKESGPKSLRIRTEKTEGVVALGGPDSLVFVDTFAEILSSSSQNEATGDSAVKPPQTNTILGLLPGRLETVSWSSGKHEPPLVIHRETSILFLEDKEEQGLIRNHPNWLRRASLSEESKELAMACRRIFDEARGNCETALYALIRDSSPIVRSLGYRLWGDLGRFDIPLSLLSQTDNKEDPVRSILVPYFREVMKRDEETVQRLADAIDAVRR